MKRTPINNLVFVKRTEVKEIQANEITAKVVGEKAFGLTTLPAKWTLPFFVVSQELFKMCSEDKKDGCWERLENEWKDKIEKAAQMCGIFSEDDVIVRSNACVEGLWERGKYSSVEGVFSEWPKLIQKCFCDTEKELGTNEQSMPIIIQKRVQALAWGHISNERRVAKEIRDWKGEIEVGALPQLFSIAIRQWRKKINISEYESKKLACPNNKIIKNVLHIPCEWATSKKIREHFEWVYDGNFVYLVQADEEIESTGVDPTKIDYGQIKTNNSNDEEFPFCVHKLSANDLNKYEEYAKIRNPLLYESMGERTAPLYVIDDPKCLEMLENGKMPTLLEKDLIQLTKRPLIIRTDIATSIKEERQMLPRTEEIRTSEDAKRWFLSQATFIKEERKKKLIFIMHNYIPAPASAFAYAKPEESVVKIEALWGLPEGLYYYSHDKYLVECSAKGKEDCKISEKKQYKKYFVCPMENGKWEVQSLKAPYDWKPAIAKKEWVKEIANKTREIAKRENKSVSVMWFVGVDEQLYGCNVFPWYHEQFDYDETRSIPRNKLSYEKTYVIHSLQDIEYLEKMPLTKPVKVRNIQIQPIDAAILRDKSIIDRVAHVAKAIGATIILEGGVLSHAYYQLVRSGVQVEARNAFERDKSVEFNKLVRDGIPNKIRNNGEEAVTVQVQNDVLNQLLKRKLVEEALEVLDASGEEDLIAEAADILEVLEGILKQNGIGMEKVEKKKANKHAKVGGFEEGIYLKKTRNSSTGAKGKITVDEKPAEVKQKIKKSTDLRQYASANEALTRVKVPVTLGEWQFHPKVNTNDIEIDIRGKREQGTLVIEVSVYEEAEQMSFLD